MNPSSLKVDFHCHTAYSKDSLNALPALRAAARRAGLDRLVITDHNNLDGALEAVDLDPQFFIPGEEILTQKGELLAAYVTQEVPRGLSPLEAIARLRAQGAFISVSHPFDLRRHGWRLDDLLEIAPLVDAVEVFNARCFAPGVNQAALDFARQHHLPGTAGSDAHTLPEVGRAGLRLPYFAGPDELRRVMPQARVEGRLSPFWVVFASSWAKWKKANQRP